MISLDCGRGRPVAVSRAERGARVEEDLQNIRAFGCGQGLGIMDWGLGFAA